jgi:Periplasmic copper-binding protein (NosD)
VRKALLFCLAPALLIAVPAAQAVTYPAPGDPGTIKHHPNGKHVTFFACKTGKGRIHAKGGVNAIQRAVNLAAAGDTVRVCNGTYKGGVTIETKAKAGLKLIGNVKNPKKVLIELKGAKPALAQNGVIVNEANGVTVSGFWARHYKGNGFFANHVTGYTFTHLVASMGGEYGIYAFKSKGGTMSNDVGYYNNDAGFYIGGTPPQTKPLRSVLKNDKSFGNVIGFSGTNVRYVTITKSDFYNNGTGVVPNALTSEPYLTPEHNTIINNRIFWNNFDYHKGTPFKLGGTSTGDVAYPAGVGALLFGGRYNVIKDNAIFGNYQAAAGMLDQLLLAGDKNPAVRKGAVLVGNSIVDNKFGLGGNLDRNGRDVFYAGSGRQNCVSGNTGTQNNLPATGDTFQPCPFAGTNTPNQAALATLLEFATATDPEKTWIKYPHRAIKGLKPLETCKVVTDGCKGQPKG